MNYTLREPKIYFTSDLHLFQKSIIKGISKWDNTGIARDFKNEYDMSEHIIFMINQTVEPNAYLWILGDLSFGSVEETRTALKSIKCKNLHFIWGNHDRVLKSNNDLQGYFRTLDHYSRHKIKYPLKDADPYRDKWEGIQYVMMSHYAMRVWDRSHRGSWMLYGHSHTSLDTQVGDFRDEINNFYLSKKTMDVGTDNAYRILGEYRPFSFWEIKRIMDEKELLFIDHHEKKP